MRLPVLSSHALRRLPLLAAAPERADQTRKRNYKTKEETDKSKPVTGTVVVTLLIIAVVVPMLQVGGGTRMAACMGLFVFPRAETVGIRPALPTRASILFDVAGP